MKKATVLKFINPLLVLAILIQIVTVAFMKIYPSSQVFTIHEYNGFALIMIIAFHFILNWNWVRTTYFQAKKRKALEKIFLKNT